jgi:hypothetical protein
MEYQKSNSKKYEKPNQTIEAEVSEEILTPEGMISEYPGLEEIRKEVGWDKFSNWNNWPHLR